MRSCAILYMAAASIAYAGVATAYAAAAAESYPTKPIRLVVPFAPGGATDTVSRVVGQRLSERLGKTVLIDNRSGAGGAIGTEIVARAAPDGYTLTMGSSSTHAILPVAHAKLSYDPIRDFEPVALVGASHYLLVVNPNVPARSLKEFVALVKSQPGKLNYASAGHATTTHLAMASLVTVAGLEMAHVPFAGNGPASAAILSGEVQALFGALPAVMPLAKAGRLRALAISSAKRSASLPDVPSVAESGYPGFDVSLWLGIMAPKGTPRAVIARLEKELNAITAMPEVKEQLDRAGAEARVSTAAELARLVKNDIALYVKVVKATGIRIE